MVVAWDFAIYLRVQAFTAWTQRTFGVSASTWIDVLYAIAVVSAGFHKDTAFALFLAPFLTLSWAAVKSNRRRQASPPDTSPALHYNPKYAFNRMLGLALGLVCLPWDFSRGNFWIEASVLANLLENCRDLPPGPSKVRKWLTSAKDSLTRTSPTPIPAPVRG